MLAERVPVLHSTTTQARLRPRRRPSSSISTFLSSLYKSSNVSAGSCTCDAMSEMRKNPRKGHRALRCKDLHLPSVTLAELYRYFEISCKGRSV